MPTPSLDIFRDLRELAGQAEAIYASMTEVALVVVKEKAGYRAGRS